MLFSTVTRAVANIRTDDKTYPQKFNEWISPVEATQQEFTIRESQSELFSQPTVAEDESRREFTTQETQPIQESQQQFSTDESQSELFSQPTVVEDESRREFTTQETQPTQESQQQFSTDESQSELFSQPTVVEDESRREFTTQETQPTPESQQQFSTDESQSELFSQPTVAEDESRRGFFNRDPQTDLFSQPFYEGSSTPIRRRVLERGTQGAQVRGLQQRLQVHGFYDGEVDSLFGPRTEAAVIAFQQANGIEVTGLVERDTWKALEADPTPKLLTEVLTKGDRGSKVRTLQTRLQAKGYDPGPVDGVYGGLTESAVIAYQQSKALDANGVVDAQTWTALSQEWSQ
jgi:murein L,D-transpeptidase YcbB/YkuD